MAARVPAFWQGLFGRARREPTRVQAPNAERGPVVTSPSVDIAPDDPIITYFQNAPGVVEVSKLDFPSPALQALKEAGVELAVPLVSQGELVGLLNLGARLSQQEYSADDRSLLNNLATQAAPALRVAQLVRQQQAEALARERIEQELRVARLIQLSLLPKDVPNLPGWEVSARYKPARAVGGDFYDFFTLPSGRLGFVVGDVTDKGVPAALLMATTRSVMRASAQHSTSPGSILERANDLLCPDMPPKMFVTCLYGILDPATGLLRYANAGHDLPYRRGADGVVELRATGMPLGLLPGMRYEEKEIVLERGDTVLFYSDGLVEAHSPRREMFGFDRLQALMRDHPGGAELNDFLLNELASFTGSDWEQEDDVTLVTLQRCATANGEGRGSMAAIDGKRRVERPKVTDDNWRNLAEFTLPSQPGNERLAMTEVAHAVSDLDIDQARLERLKTAVAEATMNAMEHGNHYHPDQPVFIRVLASDTALSVQITDQGGNQPIPSSTTPDLDAKLAGLQTPRGWGLFLIKNMVDDLHVTSDGAHHTVELVLYLEGDTE